MDLVTQACLGGVLGELTLGRKLGARAAAWGAALGVLPDVDSLLAPLLTDLQEVTWHRSLTHSLLFCLAAPPLLGLGLHRRYRQQTERRPWLVLTFAVILTHVLLDCCTTFGTQVLWPFTATPVAFRTVSVVDPLVTLPLLAGLLVSLFLGRESTRRRWVAGAGLALATLYLLALVGVKAHVDAVLSETLAEAGVTSRRSMSKPTMGNGILWRTVAEDERGFWIGYYSILDDQRRVEHTRTEPRDEALLGDMQSDPKVERLRTVLDGYASVALVDSRVVVRDVRYGKWEGWERKESPYVFAYSLLPTPGGVNIRVAPRIKTSQELRRSFMARIRGR